MPSGLPSARLRPKRGPVPSSSHPARTAQNPQEEIRRSTTHFTSDLGHSQHTHVLVDYNYDMKCKKYDFFSDLTFHVIILTFNAIIMT